MKIQEKIADFLSSERCKSVLPQAQLMRLDSFFFGALCVMSGGRLPAALFMVFLLDSKGGFPRCKKWLFVVFRLDSKSAKVCKSCRSRQELSNEYLLAKVGVDTAENGPLKVCHKLAKS